MLTRHELIRQVKPSVDAFLVTQLVDEFLSIERRFALRDWEPAELDGGQFCEILARVLFQVDSGILSLTKSHDDCLKYVEGGSSTHLYSPRKDLLHLARVMRTIYKFRSDRGAVHISPTYTPNQMDAKLVLEATRWSFSEFLRIFWNGDREIVAKAIREILTFDTPCVGVFGDRLIVQRTDLSADEEILILLHFAGEAGMSRTELGKAVYHDPSTVTRSISRLGGQSVRQIVQINDKTWRLTDLGMRRIRMELAEKLVLD